MAFSQSSRHRSRLIREMSRDLNRTENSVASSTGSQHGTVSDSTTSDFDPENEAIMSTRQMNVDISQKLPELRDTAKKYGRWSGGRQQQDYVINTSAIGRAFPDFSQGGSSDDDFSVEVARGPKTRQNTTPSRAPQPEYSDNIDLPAVRIGNFQILNTPPLKGQVKSTKQIGSLRGSARKENQSRRGSTPQKENVPPPNALVAEKLPNYTSGATRTSNGEQRRTLAELHARVADESDGSFISDERPPTVSFMPKSSRFTTTLPRKSPLSKVRTAAEYGNEAASPRTVSHSAKSAKTLSHQQNNGTVNSNTLNPTNQSFLLPNMPEISELVTGTFKDGTPIFTSNGKVHSRFHSNGTPSRRSTYNPLDGIPVPEDEKAIFLSLQLLQEKVASLEMEKADAQRIAEELQQENYQLQAEMKDLEKRHRSDSALGMADSGSDIEPSEEHRKFVAQKTKLEAQIQTLQARLDVSDRQVSNQEIRFKTISVERDSAVLQLAEALDHLDQLKSENAALRQENEALRAQLALLADETEENTRKWQQKVQRREKAVIEMQELTRELDGTQQGNKSRSRNITSKAIDQKARRAQRYQPSQDEQQYFQLKEMNRLQSTSSKERASRDRVVQGPSAPRDGSTHSQRGKSRSRSRSRPRKAQNTAQNADESDELSDEEMPFGETTKTIHEDLNIGGQDDNFTHGSNYSSILGHGEMERLRRLVAIKRAKEAAESAERNDTINSIAASEKAPSLHGRTSKGITGILKNANFQPKDDDMTGRLSVKSRASDGVQSHTCISVSGHRRSQSDNTTANKRRAAVEEMTSAFILPDITIHSVKNGAQQPVLSENAKRVLDNIAHHDGHNCTVCTRVASFDKEAATFEVKSKQTVRVEKPIPVSDRMPKAGPYEDEPTMRPSVSPGLALATVMKSLQDELAHLKMELAQYQALFNRHDPSISKRRRKAITAKIELLVKAIDKKADQIYSLYDVLEGQKESGQELTEEEVEITLHNIGVDKNVINEAKNVLPEDDEDDEESDDDLDMDLPWEGFEETVGTTSMQERRRSWQA